MNRIYIKSMLYNSARAAVLSNRFEKYNNLFRLQEVKKLHLQILNSHDCVYNIIDINRCCFEYLVNLLKNEQCCIFHDPKYMDKISRGIWLIDKNIFIFSEEKHINWAENIKTDYYYRETDDNLSVQSKYFTSKIHHLRKESGV